MKTIFHDKESGIKLQIEGTFANSKAQVIDDEGDVVIESEGSYSEILEMISQLSGNDDKGKEEPQEACEAIVEDKEKLTNSDFHGAKVKVLEDIEDEYGDVIDKGTVTTDIRLVGADLFIEGVFVRPKDFKKLEILTDEQKYIQTGEIFIVNNDEMEYYLGFEKGEIVKFLFHREESLPLKFRNSEGVEQGIRFEDVTRLENQEGNSKRFDFCAKNNILFTEDTDLEKTKVSLTKDSSWIEDDGSLIIDIDCEDGLPYVKSNNSGYGAFVDLSKLKLRTKEYTQSLEIGDYVKVKEGKEYGGAKGFAIVTNIEDDNVRLKGIDVNSDYRETWINSVDNVIKIG